MCVCAARCEQVTYQSFWTLTANPQALQSRTVRDIAAKYGKTEAQVFFAFMHAQGVLPLTGTKVGVFSLPK